MGRLLLGLVVAWLVAAPCRAQTRPATGELPAAAEIDQAVRRGVAFLLHRQNPDGSWGHMDVSDPAQARQLEEFRQAHVLNSDDPDGATALVTLALLSAGESHQSPSLQKAIAFLKTCPRRFTYCVALRACVYSLLPQALRKTELPEDVAWLETAAISQGAESGLYTYQSAQVAPQAADLSNSQYGVLGVWYAAEAGCPVPGSYWRPVETAWRNAQRTDGGWAYRVGDSGPSYASMSVAGLATLYITNDYLHAREAQDLSREQFDPFLDAGLKWLADHFAADRNVGLATAAQSGPYLHYLLFGMERVGEASGQTRFGGHLWFAEGARWLLQTQAPDGGWVSSLGPGPDTAYALLFLARGRAPVALQKLQFQGRWNNRGRDAANVVRWLRGQTERHVNWQIVSPDATVAEMRQSPVLYAASDHMILLEEQQKRRIQQYLQQGGLLLCVNEGPDREFADSIVRLARQIGGPYEFRDLPHDHLIFRQNFPLKELPYPVRGLSNGVRELILLLPKGDLSWQWQSVATGKESRAQAFPLIGDICLYANGRANPRLKGDSDWVERSPTAWPTRQIPLARLQYPGNWDPEPQGWTRLANLMANNDGIDLLVQSVPLQPAQLTRRYPLAHLTGTYRFTLSSGEQEQLKAYLDGGGVVLFDAAGGATEAAVSFELLLEKLYPDAQLLPLPLDHPIYSGVGTGGRKLQKVAYRRFALQRLVKTDLPRLRGLSIGGRLLAVVSNEDLSAGLVGSATDGIVGYAPQSATDLARNIVLWAASGK